MLSVSSCQQCVFQHVLASEATVKASRASKQRRDMKMVSRTFTDDRLTPGRAPGGISSVACAYRQDWPLVQRLLTKYLHISVLYLLPLNGGLEPSAGLVVVCVPAAGEVVSWALEISAAGTCQVTAGYASQTMTLWPTALSAGHLVRMLL